MAAAHTFRADFGELDKAKEVTKTGPITAVALITAVSTAKILRCLLSGTTTFQSGRTARFIGGATAPRTKDIAINDVFPSE
jgi:hypothetical protein